MSPLSLRTRLTLWYTLALLAVLGLGSAVVLWQQQRIGMRRAARELDSLTTTTANLMREELGEGDALALAAKEVEDMVGAPGRAVAVLDAGGQLVAARWNGFALPSPWPTLQGGSRMWTAATATGPWQVRAQPETIGRDSLVLVVAMPLADLLRERHEVQEAMWVGIPIALLLAGSGGLWLASVGLRPITRMAERAGEIPLSGLQDLGESGRSDELGQLARAFNGLVARLRAALQTQRQFMADASHELRTPVSVIRSAGEVTLGRERREESEYREALAIVGGEARRLSRLVEDMLVLARADAGGYPLQRDTLYLDELIVECRRTVEVLASERGVGVRSSPLAEIPFVGDEELLRRMLLNIIQNAVQHTSSGRTVAIEVSSGPTAVTIDVVDQGSGIEAADRARIFERFVQLDPSRRGSGTGLGLPIACWIAQMHGGTLDLESSGASGSTFRIVLPQTASSEVSGDASAT